MADYISYPLFIAFAGDPVAFILQSTGLLSARPRFGLRLEIEPAVTVVFEPAPWWQHGAGLQDISDRLHAYFKTNYYPPNYGVVAGFVSVNMVKYNLFAQEYDGPPYVEVGTEEDSENIAPFFAIYGGSSFDRINVGNFMADQFVGTPNQFHTTCPDGKRTRIGMQEFLSFLHISTVPPSFDIHVYLTFTDGSTTDYIESFSPYDAGWDYSLHTVPVSYTALNIESNTAGKTVWFYEVEIEYSGSAITERRRFYIDHNVYARERRLIWKNSRGGEDSYYFTGLDKLITENTHRSADHYVNVNTQVYEGTRTIHNKKEFPSVRTGTWLASKEEAEWLRDLFLSTHVFEDNGVQWLPVEVLSLSDPVWDEEKSGFGVVIEYKYQFHNTHYTP